MNYYERFVKKQNEIINLIHLQEVAEIELTTIKKAIFIKHSARFKKKPLGKTVINDGGFEIVYNRTEKVSLLTSLIKRDDFKSDCISEKITPEKKSLNFSKTEYKKLSDDEQAKVNNYLAKEMNKPTMSVKIKDAK